MTILLFRHGENDYVKKGRLAGRLPGVHLNEKGRKQAKALADKMNGAASRRCTAAHWKGQWRQLLHRPDFGLEIIKRQGLMEVDFGDWQDKTLKSLPAKVWKTVVVAPSQVHLSKRGVIFPGAAPGATGIILPGNTARGEEYWIVCVSHGDMIKLAISYFIGLPLDMFQRAYCSGLDHSFEFIESSSHLLTMNYDMTFTLPKD